MKHALVTVALSMSVLPSVGNQESNLTPSRVPLSFESFHYPAIAKSASIEGTVALRVTVGEAGTVEDVVAIDGPRLLVDAAINNLRTWTYRPGPKRTIAYSYVFEIDGFCPKEPTPTLVRMRSPYNVVKVTSCQGWPE